MQRKSRIAVLVSGHGSNLQAVLDAIGAGRLAADIVGVFSDKPDCIALTRVAENLRWSRDAKAYNARAQFDTELADAVAASAPDWVICAGYMRILGDTFVERFAGQLINIHPSLLPKYKGLHTHRRALEDQADGGQPRAGSAVCLHAPGPRRQNPHGLFVPSGNGRAYRHGRAF